MFFDLKILNPQHRGHFSHAWLAATRGVKFISKRTIQEIDIAVLCNHLADFITTSTKDPKKRFSLRLSIILINGTVKIYREKVILLQAQVISAFQYIRVPAVVRSTSTHIEEGPFETPPTPIAKVKTKRGKKQIVETPTLVPPLPDGRFQEGMLQLPEIEDIGQLQPATSDMISLREEAPRRTEELLLEDEGFGVLTGKELELEIESLLPRSRVEPVAPLTSSSEPTPPQVMEVVALVHAGRGEFLEKFAAAAPEVQVPIGPEITLGIIPSLEVAEIEEPIAPIQQPTPMEIVEAEVPPTVAALEKRIPTPEIIPVAVQPPEKTPTIAIMPEKEPSPKELSVLPEIQPLAEPVEVVREKTARVKEPERKLDGVGKKVKQDRDKLFLGNKRKVFVRINRCNENEGRFVDVTCKLPSAFKNIHNENLYNMFWFEEDVDGVRAEVRAGSSIRSSSLRASIGLVRTPGHRTRSTLEKDLTDSLGRRVSEMETPQKLMQSLEMGDLPPASEERPRQLPIEEPPIPVRPPSREQQSILEQEPFAVTLGKEPPVVQPTVLDELPLEGVPPSTEVSVPMETVPIMETVPPLIEELPQLHEEVVVPVEELVPPTEKFVTPTAERKKTKRFPKSPAVDYKLRHQKIIDLVEAWNFSESLLTIENICEEPFDRLNMARAFYDLLVLSAKKYLILCTEDDSLQLKCIQKGPRLERA